MPDLEATTPADDFAVEVSQVRKVYGSGSKAVVGVDNVDITVNKGELLVLLGPSGCGKTTLLRSIAGLEKPVSGRIRIGSREVYSSRDGIDLPPEKRHVGMMFQSYALWPHMTVLQNVAYPLGSKGLAREAVREKVLASLENLGVGGLEHRFPGELSGGQQQRVALARALISSPSVILFDEPLSNVDARIRRHLREQIRSLKAETGFAGVYVTHDQEEAMELADKLAVMDRGQIRQISSSQGIYRRPASLYVASFVGEINQIPGKPLPGRAVPTFETPLGVVELPSAPEGSDLGAGEIICRPEHVAILKGGEALPAGQHVEFKARVVNTVYMGPRSEVTLDIAGAKLKSVVTEPGWTDAGIRNGEIVSAGIRKDLLLWIGR